MRTFASGFASLVALASVVDGACIPEVPQKLVSDPTVLGHPAVSSALKAIERNLAELFVNTTEDGLSFAIV